MKIRTKINLSFLATFALIFSLFSLFVYFYTTALVKNDVYSYLYVSGRARAEHVRTYIQEKENTSKILAAASVYRDFLKEPRGTSQFSVIKGKIDRRFKRTLVSDPEIYETFILDANGKVLASSDQSQEGKDKSSDLYFVNAKENVFFKDFYFSETIKEVTYAIAVPVKDDDGTFLGVSVLRYLPNEFYSIVKSENGLGKTEENFLINKDGFFITPSLFWGDSVILKEKVTTKNARDCYDPREIEYVKKNGYSGLRNLFGSQIVEAKDYRNVDIIATHAYIPETGWCLITKADRRDLLSFELVALRIFVIVFIIAGLFIILISLLVSRTITKPILSLVKGTEKIKRGNFSSKVEIESSDEVGVLAGAFNDMAARLADIYNNMDELIKKRTKELEEKNKDLERVSLETKKALESTERVNKLMIGRELKMAELKREISELKNKIRSK